MNSPRRILILGSTGSIGVNTVAVLEHLASHGRPFQVIGLAAGRSAAVLAEQAIKLRPTAVALASGDDPSLRNIPTGTDVITGTGSALELVRRHARRGDLVVGAMVGAEGIPPLLAAIDAGCDIALANKETLVAAGELVTSHARRAGIEIIPVDSEHSAILQCMRGGSPQEVERIVLTASGGPFRRASREQLESATLADALRHPTWSMGRKVTIDSATMMNKALEVIEAHWLFNLPAERIDAIVHPQSVVHSFVEYRDGSVLAQLSPPDMRLPIELALTWPERASRCATAMDWQALRTLDFEPVDHERFPAVSLAWQAIRAGGSSGATLNAANEAAVEAFIDGQVRFAEIARLVRGALEALPVTPVATLDHVLAADRAARAWVQSRIAAEPVPG
jgi:1-deoxy-D-xylulose-5-phosphate reductoisomerase